MNERLDIKEICPDLRVWEYDGDGTKIYKLDQGYNRKTVYTKEHYFNVHFWKENKKFILFG